MNQRMCDIHGCESKALPYRVDYVQITVVPTGNSDYSSREENDTRNEEFDLCKNHANEYDKRISRVLVQDETGLFFP